MKQFPIARQKDLIIEELPDEVLVYDLTTDRAHCLNRVSALIWKNCDGEKSEGEIAQILEQELDSPVPRQVVMLGLQELAALGFLQENEAIALRPQLSRRRLIQHLGVSAAIALPVIMSISAPTAAGAATDPCATNPRGIGCQCTTDNDCDSANCNGGICGPEL